MIDPRFWRIERAAGTLLVLGFVANFAGVLLFNMRGGISGGAPPSPAYYMWERGFLMAAIVLTAIGFGLLDGYLHNTDGQVLARAGATAYLFAGTLGVAAEGLELSRTGPYLYPLSVIYVVLAFLAQAAIGGALRQSRLLAVWIGWATILWNLAWLAVLLVITRDDIYFPILHHLMPLLLGSALLWRAPVRQTSTQQTGQQEARVLQ